MNLQDTVGVGGASNFDALYTGGVAEVAKQFSKRFAENAHRETSARRFRRRHPAAHAGTTRQLRR
jgi:hypothetical protein